MVAAIASPDRGITAIAHEACSVPFRINERPHKLVGETQINKVSVGLLKVDGTVVEIYEVEFGGNFLTRDIERIDLKLRDRMLLFELSEMVDRFCL
jgi:hypothetical protein